MLSIKAFITAFLSATVLANPVSSDLNKCSIYTSSTNSVLNVTRFDGSSTSSDKNSRAFHIVSNKLAKGDLQVYAYFDPKSRSVIKELTIVHMFAFGDQYVKAFMKDGAPDVIQTIKYDGKVSETTKQGTFDVLDGFVKYTVANSMEAVTINFIIDNNIFIDVLIGEPNARGTPVLTLKQSRAYDHSPMPPWGDCVY